ncbi:uncharacterized protein LOC113789637 [Dermatophagoides pteronyssinus]|uniref:Uncharacterized protein LOC113789637 n=1 Tax=Dermatophagoides pteronyssinus TaxID=6956 RepID=A0A6P6XNG0_DERPT|nr:uncharacterized protein LOC113789637 [Dermatophagoides pteronyssinus]
MSVFVRKIFGWLCLTHLIWSGQSYHCGGQFWSSKSQFLSAYVPCRIQNDHPGLMALPSDNFQLARQPQDDRFESIYLRGTNNHRIFHNLKVDPESQRIRSIRTDVGKNGRHSLHLMFWNN